MIQRAIIETILEDLSFFPVVGIIGPRQVGKTTLAKEIQIKNIKTQEEHWLKGGFPEALLAPSEKFTWRWLQNFIRTFIERDLRELGHEVSNVMLSRLLSMLSHIQGQLLNSSELSRSLGVSAPTVNRYLDLLEGSFIINRLQPYFRNIKKRLVKSPKVYFRDSGVLHQISNIHNRETLLGHIVVGASWEGYVIEQIRRVSENRLEMYFYRTHGGAESDLVLIGPGNHIACIEIKLSNAPSVSKGFYQSINDIGPEFKYVVCPHTERYERSGGIIVCSLGEFLEKELLNIYGNRH